MTTYGIMQDRIADELARSDLTSQIKLAIQTAIDHYEREPFYFNEATGTFATVADQEYYSSTDAAFIATLAEIHSMRVTVGSQPLRLEPQPWSWFEDRATGTYTGYPYNYVYYKQNIRLYPIPDDAYTVTVGYVARPATLSTTADTNVWMTDGEELIRLRAKIDLHMNVIREPTSAGEIGMLQSYLDNVVYPRLKGESIARMGARITPTQF